jgi:hypothetical protein
MFVDQATATSANGGNIMAKTFRNFARKGQHITGLLEQKCGHKFPRRNPNANA